MRNNPLVIKESVSFNSVCIRSLWDVNADESYINKWPKDRRLPIKDNTLVIIFSEKGNGIIKLNNGRTILSRGNCLIFLDPASIDKYWCDGYIWKLYWIEIFIDAKKLDTIKKNEVFQIENYRHFEIQCKELLEVLKHQSSFHRDYAASLFNKIFFEWIVLTNTEVHSKSYRKVISVIEEMHHQLATNWQIKSMAEYSGCSEQYLRKLFIAHTGHSPKDYYMKLKLDIALGMLKRGHKSISQIAYELGFSDAYHFSNVFKKRFGHSPSKVEQTTEVAKQIIRAEVD